MYCRMNRVECRYADMNGYCDSTACHNMNLVGNIIPKQRLENIGIGNSSIWVKPQSNWHKGTPTEEGWYLLHLKKDSKPYCVAYMDGRHWLGINDFFILVDDVKAWMPIEPYKED